MDSRHVGTIAALKPDAFAIQTSHEDIMWLKRDSIFTVLPEGVTLICGSSQVDRYRVQPA